MTLPNVGKSFCFLQQNSAKIFAFCRFFDSLPYSPQKVSALRAGPVQMSKNFWKKSKFAEKVECFLKFSEKNQILLKSEEKSRFFFKTSRKKLNFVKICRKKSSFFLKFRKKTKFCQNLLKKAEFIFGKN